MVKQYRTPGPKYDAPSTIGYDMTDLRIPRAPAYTMGILIQQQRRSLRVPGPQYDLRNITHHGPVHVAGAFVAAPRPRERSERTPGPAKYNIVPCMPVTMPMMPSFTMGMKRNERKKLGVTPAPNKYMVGSTIGNTAPDLPSAPMYTIPGRSNALGMSGGRVAAAHASPGPARYPVVDIDRFKRQPPRPVILGRPNPNQGRTKRTPAPNAYAPGPILQYANAPQFTIAGRIPNRASPYYTAADKVPNWE